MLNNTPAPPEEVADKLGISVYKEFLYLCQLIVTLLYID